MASGKQFVRPSSKEAILAVGLEDNKSQFMEFLRKCTETRPDNSDGEFDLFPPIETPGPGDWLSCFPTKPEPFYEWQSKSRNHVRSWKRTIYILPLGEFAADIPPDNAKEDGAKMDTVGQIILRDLEIYTQLFFPGMIVKLLKEVPLSKLKCQSRCHTVDYGVTREQLMIPGIFDYMKNVLPQDAYCMLAVTMMDLYPDEDWNFVFGEASYIYWKELEYLALPGIIPISLTKTRVSV